MTNNQDQPDSAPLIALIDDDPAVLAFLEDLLSSEGYRVITAQTRNTGYDLIQQVRPDLVLVDIRMDHPRDGWILLDLLHASPRTQAIPVIVCSADVGFLREKEHRMHAKGWIALEKPFNIDQVLTTIRHMLDPSSASQPVPDPQGHGPTHCA
jgi:DNA-binding response OmpR family regulator